MYEDFAIRGPFSALVAPFMRADRDDADGADDLGGEPDGAGDDSQSSDDDATAGSEDDDASALEARGGADDDDADDEEDDDRYAGLPEAEQLKRLRAALKRNKRRLRARTPDYEQVQALRRNGMTLDDLIHTARSHRSLTQAIQANPRLRALLEGDGDDDGDRRPARRGNDRRSGEDEFTFDDSPEALGFDPKESKANARLAATIKAAEHANWRFERLERTLKDAGFDPKKVLQRIEGVEKTFQAQSQTSITREWNEAIEAAIPHITDPNPKRQAGLRAMFKDNMLHARRDLGGTRAAADLAKHYLGGLGISPAAAKRGSAAAARSTATVASRVTQLPRHPQQHGTPAPAKQKRESIRDVTRRISQNVGTPASAR